MIGCLIVIGVLFVVIFIMTREINKLSGVLNGGLDKAVMDNCETVRIPFNDVAEALGRDPIRLQREFNKVAQVVHPARLRPSRRRKL